MSDLFSEEIIQEEVNKYVRSTLPGQIKVAVDQYKTDIRKEVEECAGVSNMSDFVKKAVNDNMDAVKQHITDFMTNGGLKTTITNTVQNFIKNHGFIPTALSEVEKNVIVQEVTAKVMDEFDIAEKIKNNPAIRQAIGEVVLGVTRRARILSMAAELREMGLGYEASNLESSSATIIY